MHRGERYALADPFQDAHEDEHPKRELLRDDGRDDGQHRGAQHADAEDPLPAKLRREPAAEHLGEYVPVEQRKGDL